MKLDAIYRERAKLKVRLRELEVEEQRIAPMPKLRDTEGKVYRRKAPNARATYRVDKVDYDYSMQPYYNFVIVRVRLVNIKNDHAIWVQDSEFRNNFVEVIDD